MTDEISDAPPDPMPKRRRRKLGPKRTQFDDHPQRERIEYDLACGMKIRAAERKYGLSRGIIGRAAKRIPAHLRAANLAEMLKPGADLDQLRNEESRGLLAVLANQRVRLLRIQDEAMAAGNNDLAIKAAGQIHRGSEIIGSALGEFVQHHRTESISVMLTPEYAKLRRIVMDTLRDHPAALQSFTQRMQAMEADELRGVQAALPAPETA